MDTRSERYANNDTSSEEVFGSRAARNAGLYREIREADVGNYNVHSNSKVIDSTSGNSIDVEHIKSILDTHYHEAPRIRTIPIEDIPKRETKTESVFENTKEYDINSILNKAKEGREENYEEDRAKKLRDTQFDILNNLNINPKDYIEEYDDDNFEIEDTGVSIETSEETSRTLQDLIDTIALNEKAVRKELDLEKDKELEENSFVKELDDDDDTDPLDIFEDLKGDDNTVTLDGLKEKTEALMAVMDDNKDIKDRIREEFGHTDDDTFEDDEDDKTKKLNDTSSLDKSFFTTSTTFKDSDFESFEDIEGKHKLSAFGKFVIIVLVLAFLAGVAILVKSFL